MTRKHIDELGTLQQAVMEVLWDRGEGTVQAVRSALAGAQRAPAYTTVLSVLQKLEKAGWVEHRAEGRAYVYMPTRTRSEEGTSAVWKFVDGVFQGDPTLMFQHLIDDDRIDAGDLDALRRLIDERRRDLGETGGVS